MTIRDNIIPILLHSVMILMLASCRRMDLKEKVPAESNQKPGSGITIQYASRFRVRWINGYKVIDVSSPWPGSSDMFTYILVDSPNANILPEIPNARKISVPVKSIVCFSTSHLPFLEMIGVADRLTGFPNTSYISSPVFRQRVEEGKIRDLGPSNDVNLESLLALDPGLVMAFSMGNDFGMLEKMMRAGIPVVLNADYMENSPLGRAEWIKFIGAFFNRDFIADSIFHDIETSYLQIKNLAAGVTEKPSVFTGVVYGDSWFLPGGQNYASVFFRDAGARYVWSDNTSSSVLQLSYEAVYEKAGKADLWLGTASYNSLEDLKNADERYSHFNAFRENHVYNYDARLSPSGGNEYFESGYARPDRVLADLVAICHPELMKNYKLYFYRKIE